MDLLPNPENNPVRQTVNELVKEVESLKQSMRGIKEVLREVVDSSLFPEDRPEQAAADPQVFAVEVEPEEEKAARTYDATARGWRPLNDGEKFWMPAEPGHPDFDPNLPGPGAVEAEKVDPKIKETYWRHVEQSNENTSGQADPRV